MIELTKTKSYKGIKSFLIARVSDPEQHDALPAQEYRLNDYAQKHGFDYELFSFDETAYKADRLEFEKIAHKIAKYTKFRVVVFDKIDRYARDASSEIVRNFKNLVRAGKMEIHFPSDGLIYHKDSPACDIAKLGMGMVFGEYYSASISDNVKRKIEQKLRDGEWIGQAPFGYRNLPRNKNEPSWIEPNEKASIVLSIFKQYASGAVSMRTIQDWLHKDCGLKTPLAQVCNILKNPFYYGYMRVKGVLYPHKYRPIISKELFDKAQEISQGFKKVPYKYAGLPYLYRGLIACSECGCRITPEKSKGHIYYHCTQFKGKHNAPYIREEEITKQFREAIEAIQPTKEQYESVLVALRDSQKDVITFKKNQTSIIQAELQKLSPRIERLYDSYLDGDIEREEYKQRRTDYSQQKLNLENRLLALKNNDVNYYDNAVSIMKLARSASLLFEKSSEVTEKQQFLKILFQNFEFRGRQLLLKYKKPFDILINTSKGSLWLPILDAFMALTPSDLCDIDIDFIRSKLHESEKTDF
jgi:DNA invertase Pin-like site-specific DNA recombinase